MGFLSSFGKSILGSVVVLVLEIKDHIKSHEAEVQHVEPDDIIDLVVDELVDDAEDVAQKDETHENGAFAFGDLRPQRLGDTNRPADGEAEEEQNLEYFHFKCLVGNAELGMRNAEQGLAPFSIPHSAFKNQSPNVATMTALMVCIRFSASSKTMLFLPSKTSSVTSMPSKPNCS